MSGLDDQRKRTLTRRSLLTTVGAGVAAGGLALGWEVMRDDSGTRTGDVHAGGDSGPPPQTVLVYGGADNAEARDSVLKVWAGKPRVAERNLRAGYTDVATSSADQLKRFENLFSNGRQDADLLIVDPEYLRGMVDAGQIAEFADLSEDWLKKDLGCIGAVADSCIRDGKVYAVPLNTDIPMLAFNASMIDPAKARSIGTLKGSDFWNAALELARGSAGDDSTKRISLTSGANEGFTTCLAELVVAFDPREREPGTLPERSEELSAVCGVIRKSFGRDMDTFRLRTPGDEDQVYTELKEEKVAVARLWPSYCRDLAKYDPGKDESTGATFEFVPIPGGVLGGQVMVVGRHSDRREQAQELALYLAGAASQLQLNYNGGYVPTLAELYRDEHLSASLNTLDAGDIAASVRRPSKPDYAKWSARWREEARGYLLA